MISGCPLSPENQTDNCNSSAAFVSFGNEGFDRKHISRVKQYRYIGNYITFLHLNNYDIVGLMSEGKITVYFLQATTNVCPLFEEYSRLHVTLENLPNSDSWHPNLSLLVLVAEKVLISSCAYHVSSLSSLCTTTTPDSALNFQTRQCVI